MGLAGTQPSRLLGEVDGRQAVEQRRKGRRNKRGLGRPEKSDQCASVERKAKTRRVS